ncbi:similar to cytochrome P450 [Botrytis cinerea T4]|uniref:Similar to cytochrome P450 n=1 Tax=Botryotinia fuckeliana (strain T4) TaxID=999810 RepID=G2XZP0_BOTF4|nr:similar to cytochrome P450 [Botrytis cinerea T4]
MIFLIENGSFVLIALFFCSIVSKVAWELFFSPLRHFPGPVAARFTNIYRAFKAYLGSMDNTQRNWHRNYGVAVRIGPKTISLSDPSLIGTIYATKNAWLKDEMYKPNDALIEGKRMSNIFNSRDPLWHEKYVKPIRSLWTMTSVLNIEPLVDETLEMFIKKLSANFADGLNTCMVDDWLAYFAWDVTANISFGRPFGLIDQGKDVDDILLESKRSLYYFAVVSQIPWIDHLLDKNPIIRFGPRPTVTGIMYCSKVVAQYREELLSAGHKHKTINHYLDKYFKLKEKNPDLIDDNQIVTYLILSILAGGDTTASTMRAVLYYLSKNTSAYTKLTDELDHANLSLPAQWKDVHNLPYLSAVLHETMRINPASAMMLERLVPNSGFTLPDGRYIPGGTTVGISPAVSNRDAKTFGSDVDAFNPDRWLQMKGESLEDFEIRHKQMVTTVNFTFGGGNRVCMGKYLVQLELWKTMATLYSIFDIKLENPNHTWKIHNAVFVYQWDIPMKISRRTRA